MLNLEKSLEAFEEAKTLMPGGVNSPVRSYQNVDCNPPFIARGEGAHIFDIDGNEYVDYVLSWGPLVAGHAHPAVVSALADAAARGTSYGAPTTLESDLVRLVQKAYPSMQLVRMVNSGTEATMSALRLARGFTGRSKIVKFVGCYHGHSDSLLVDAGSGLATFGVPSSPGVTEGVAKDTITVPFNDADAITRVMTEYGNDIACIIVEPVAGNMGCVLPENGYLDTLRTLTEKHGALLIFDEVMCGFRASLGGAQAAYGITPDLTCLGKIIGGGLPCAAYGGRRDIMEQIAPAGPVYQAGTLSGNPLATAAGLATLQLADDAVYASVAEHARTIGEVVSAALNEQGVPHRVQRAGSLFSFMFGQRAAEQGVSDYEAARAQETWRYGPFFHAFLEAGVGLPPSVFEAWFVSAAHGEAELEAIAAAAPAAARAAARAQAN